MGAREHVADFWDDRIEGWIAGKEDWTPELRTWFDSYDGRGKGTVDLSCYPDPYVGDLRGINGEPRVVVLGLNPGVGYQELQGREGGIWTERIRQDSYSRALDRTPFEDSAWLKVHGKASPYWNRLMRWARAWTGDAQLPAYAVLNFELYPWHSNAVTAVMTPPGDLIERYVWEPVGEVDVDVVFAFGKPWVDVCRRLGLPLREWYGDGHLPMPGPGSPGWNVVVFALPSGQSAVVSWQPGYSGPPGKPRLETLRKIVATRQD